jgi:hypothetical protein
MAKNSIRDYSAVNSSNTDIQSIDISEGCSPAGINNAIREVMADLKDVSTGAVALESPKFDSILDGNIKATDASGTDVAGTDTTIKGGAGTGTGAGGSIAFQVADGAGSTGSSVNAHATAMTISDDGNVGIGTTSPTASLTLGAADNEGTLRIGDNGTYYGEIKRINASDELRIGSYGAGQNLTFHTVNAERMRINSTGRLLFATTNTNPSVNNVAGATIWETGRVEVSTASSAGLYVNRGTDGTLVSLRAQGVTEGSINVSGSTVSFNGGHLARWSQLADGTRDETLVKGTVLTNLDQMAVWHHEAVAAQDAVLDEEGNVVTEAVQAKDAYTEDNEQLNCMAVSSVEGDPNVAGVFVNWDDDDDFNDMNIAMTGDMVIRIASGTTVARGDLLMSAGDGTAKPQGDDIVRSKTIAKVTSTNVSHTYDDGSYLVPCVLMAC